LLAQKGLPYEEAARKIKEAKKKMTPVERKIDGHLLTTIRKMTDKDVLQKLDSIEVDKVYSNGFIRVDKEARIYVKIMLKRSVTKSDVAKFVNSLHAPATKVVNYNYPASYVSWMPEIYCWMQYDQISEIVKDDMITFIGPVIKPRNR